MEYKPRLFVGIKRAKASGYTHWGLMYGLLPCYLFFSDEGMGVEYPFLPMHWIDEHLITPIWFAVQSRADVEPSFSAKVMGELSGRWLLKGGE